MKVVSARFGSLDFPDNKVLTFPDGLLGFEQAKRYIICDHDEKTPFKWLQSVDDPKLAFVIISPFEFLPDFGLELGRDDVLKLGLKDVDEAVTFVLVTIPSDPVKMTANLQGPLVMNVKNRVGRQVVLGDGKYSPRLPILEAMKALKVDEKRRPEYATSMTGRTPMVAVGE